MTLDEAIEILKTVSEDHYWSGQVKISQAEKLGIEALKWRRYMEGYSRPAILVPLPGETEE